MDVAPRDFENSSLGGSRLPDQAEEFRGMTEATRVRDLMSSVVTSLDMNDQLTIADDIMKLGRIRHLPVLGGDGRLVGILSQRDLFRGALARTLGYGEHAQQKLFGILRVKEVMTNDPETIEPDAPAAEAARRLVEKKIGCLVVVDGGGLAGILTETDFVAAYASGGA